MKLLKSLAISGIVASSLFALQEHNLDYMSMGTGDAGVASTYGSMSAFQNPALVNDSDNKRTEFGLEVGIGIQEHQLGDDLNKLDKADVSDTLDQIEKGNGNDNDVESRANQITDALKSLSDKENNYLLLSPNSALSFKMGRHLALGIYVSADAKAKAVVDKNRLEYIYYDSDNDKYVKYDPNADGNDYSESDKATYKAKSVEYAMQDINTTRLDINAISIAQIPITYANNITLSNSELNWGISLKYMHGETSKTKILFTDDNYDPLQKLDENTVTTDTFGIDLGLLYHFKNFKLGVSGKNLNSPEFDTIEGNKYKLEPKVTAGIAFSATDLIDIMVDYDFTKIHDELTNQDFQYVGGGINFHPLTWLDLRLGAKQNLADSNNYNGTIYTAGIGFGLKWLQLDASVQASQNSGNYDGDEIPRYVKANISLISRWGNN